MKYCDDGTNNEEPIVDPVRSRSGSPNWKRSLVKREAEKRRLENKRRLKLCKQRRK